MTTQQHDPDDPTCDCPECMERCRVAVELDRIWRAWREQEASKA